MATKPQHADAAPSDAAPEAILAGRNSTSDRLDPSMEVDRGLLRTTLQRRIALPALRVALVVGTILNAVNNGVRLLADQAINWRQFARNFVVPSCVASYSAARNEAQVRGRRPR